MSAASASYCNLSDGSSPPLDAAGDSVAWGSTADEQDWDMASNYTAGETGPGGHNIVPPGVVGAEYRLMKEALDTASSPRESGSAPPQRDPYHGRTTDPKTLREPPRESFNLMVVGEAGLGKTTLLESFFKSFKDDEAAFALFERKETATEIDTRRQLAEAQVRRNAAERELQAAVEKAQYTTAHVKQEEIERLTQQMAIISERLKELSAADERRRNELRCLREATRAARLEMKRAADQGSFVVAAEFQLEASLLQDECDLVQAELKRMRRGDSHDSGVSNAHDDDEEEEPMRAGHRALTNATVTVKAFDPFAISVGKHELQVTLVDTPGYGETLHAEESFETICSYVDGLFERQLRAESAWTGRDAERLRLQDPLVHVCLYFIAPHRLKHIDIAFMRALHRKVNIVPIIAKSDTMTTKEKEEFKMQVREALQREGIEAYPFDVSVLRQMEQQDKQEYRLPWAVIGSTDAYLEAGTTVYLRKYPWGNALSSEPAHSVCSGDLTATMLAKQHSHKKDANFLLWIPFHAGRCCSLTAPTPSRSPQDLPALRNMIMWSGQWHDLKMASRAKYEAWRAQRPLRKRSSAAIASAGRALVAKVTGAVEKVAGAWQATKRMGAAACIAVGVPPRYGARALLVLLLALSASLGPQAVRWATGTDLSVSRKLALARAQVEQLVLEKARLVERYEKEVNAIKVRLHDSQSTGEVHAATFRAHEIERAELQRALRAAHTRAELAETSLASATSDCTLWNPIMSGAKAASSKLGGAVAGASERVVQSSKLFARDAGEAVAGIAKETPSFLTAATGRTVDISRDL